jgi:hypothetical protein
MMMNDELFTKVVPDRKLNGDVYDQKERKNPGCAKISNVA